ncbi:sulfate ABC transporter permease subunit CysT [Alkalilimnicola ehrlichii]|uniref:Sulfate transport system permease protein CysT n=1 Tax=Alkalilimnicola ehrlichii TaxID=351052 RepID=A0A3E0X2T4_9GAMM|nr:sulfate ABC transporter permease subunit CysT [Alkalilimnicola ehrlichii]RFA30999.1 sulfate ABC transporter permease subunit CysT [Alkalilimnicola ehrlichii]RFA38951.1 sulfate ABC transporter permease subunit CysT [Alkalilimnicola ehrlichii]
MQGVVGGRPRSKRVLPGFGLTMGTTLLFISLVIMLPLSALLMQAASLGPAEFWHVISSERAVATYRVTLTSALAASLFNCVFGVLLAWVLTRYEFFGRGFLDALVDIPFALPTAVAGLSLTFLFSRDGWLGQFLTPLGIEVAYTQLGIIAAMAFTSAPFVVRSVQPVLEDMEPEVEEAAASLGANALQVFARVIFPMILPAVMAGFALSFARSLGEFGAIIFIAGNMPFETEITALLIMTRLEEYNFGAAAAIASVVLAAALLMLLVINILQGYVYRHQERNG